MKDLFMIIASTLVVFGVGFFGWYVAQLIYNNGYQNGVNKGRADMYLQMKSIETKPNLRPVK